MIKKEDLLKTLIDGRDKEEKGIPLYTMHLSNAMFLSHAPTEHQKKIKDVLTTLRKDSNRHMLIYQTLIDKITRESKDVY